VGLIIDILVIIPPLVYVYVYVCVYVYVYRHRDLRLTQEQTGTISSNLLLFSESSRRCLSSPKEGGMFDMLLLH
jgi:hypothetical protein